MKFSRNVTIFWTDTAHFINPIYTDDLRLHYVHYIPWPRWVGPWCLRPGLVTVQWPVPRWAWPSCGLSLSPARLTGRKLFLCFSHNFTVTDNIIGITHPRGQCDDPLLSSGGLMISPEHMSSSTSVCRVATHRDVTRAIASPRLSQHAQILIMTKRW